MAQLNTDYVPGAVSTTTPGVLPADNDVLQAFIARRMAEYEEARKKQLQQQIPMGDGGRGVSARNPGLGSAPVRYEYEGLRAPVDERERAMSAIAAREVREQANEARDERAYRARMRQIDLMPPQRLVPGGFNMTPYYTENLPISLRPQNAGFVTSPDDQVRASEAATKDADFNARLRYDRARGY